MIAMYIPASFKIADGAEIRAFIQQFDFATIVSSPQTGLLATHAPVVVRSTGTSELVVLGHVARDNPHWRVMDGSVESLVIFHGPQSYVSPTWYVNSPAVPTWNYAVVHAYGKLQFRQEPDFIENVLAELVGRYEMRVLKVEAKFKLGQNRRPEDRNGTITGLESEKTPEGVAMAEFMRSHL